MDEYVATVCDWLRAALWEAQAQSMAEAQWQKWHYDWKIGAVDLKPGDLVLVKADAFKGKRKIRDRWEDEACVVVHQIMTDIPSYKVTDQCGQSCILHWNQLLLIASEVGIPLCVGDHHAWDWCTSPTSVKPTCIGSESRIMPWEHVVRQSSNAWPARLPWGGSMGSYDFYHGHLQEHPLMMGEDFK